MSTDTASAVQASLVFDMRRGGRAVAQVVLLPSGRAIVDWPTSTIVYTSLASARDVHITHMGGRGEETSFDLVAAADASERGWTDAIQDDMEGALMLAARVPGFEGTVVAPGYIPEADREAWCAGYEAALTLASYGERWQEMARGGEFVATPSFRDWTYLTKADQGSAGDGGAQ